MSYEELLARLESICDDYQDRAQPSRSGKIDPSDEDLANEAGQREAYSDIASDLADLLKSARTK